MDQVNEYKRKFACAQPSSSNLHQATTTTTTTTTFLYHTTTQLINSAFQVAIEV